MDTGTSAAVRHYRESDSYHQMQHNLRTREERQSKSVVALSWGRSPVFLQSFYLVLVVRSKVVRKRGTSIHFIPDFSTVYHYYWAIENPHDFLSSFALPRAPRRYQGEWPRVPDN